MIYNLAKLELINATGHFLLFDVRKYYQDFFVFFNVLSKTDLFLLKEQNKRIVIINCMHLSFSWYNIFLFYNCCLLCNCDLELFIWKENSMASNFKQSVDYNGLLITFNDACGWGWGRTGYAAHLASLYTSPTSPYASPASPISWICDTPHIILCNWFLPRYVNDEA
jgi:hypothetical protein